MAVKLSQRAYGHARALIRVGRAVVDERDAWSEHRPRAADENVFIEAHGWEAYGRWHLGVDSEQRETTKAHCKFPYGDFSDVHRTPLRQHRV